MVNDFARYTQKSEFLDSRPILAINVYMEGVAIEISVMTVTAGKRAPQAPDAKPN